MRQANVIKTVLLEEELNQEAFYEVVPQDLQNDALQDEIQIIKQETAVEYAINNRESIGKKGLRLIELRSPPQIDGNLALGTHYYLQRHVFMLFTDVILALLMGNSLWILQSTALAMDVSILSYLGIFCPIYFSIIKCFWHVDGIYPILILASYGHDNILYYIISGLRLVFFYGLCYTGPSVYNSGNGALFAFSIFLTALRFLILIFKCLIGLKLKKFRSSGLTLNLSLESIPAILYLAMIIIQNKLSHRLDLIYIIWAIGIVLDFISLVASDGLSVWNRIRVQPENLNEIISKKSYIEQLNSDSYDRMKVLTLAAFGWGGSQLFPTRKGVGMPDLYVSFDYNIKDFLTGMMGILIIFFMMRSYSAVNGTRFSSEECSKKLNILILVQRMLQVFIHALLFLFLNLLKQCIANIWDNNNLYPGSGFYFKYAEITGYQFALWRSLPYPTKDTFSNFLRPWVANQTSNSTPPPGLYSIPSSMTGTSLLNSSLTDPGAIFCITLGLLYILLLFMHWSSKFIEISQDEEMSFVPIIITLNTFLKIIIAVIFFALAAIDVQYISILWKMCIITVITFIQVIWDDSQRILSYGRSFT